MEINDFIKSVNDVCSMSNRMQVPVKDLPHKLQQMLNEANLLAEEVKRKDKSWPAMDSILRRLRRSQQYAQQGFYYYQVLNLAVWHDALLRRSIVLSGL